MCGQDLCFGNQFVDAHDNRRPADSGGAAAIGVSAIMGHGGITAHNDNVFSRDSEFIGGDLGKGGFLTLAVRRGACDHGNLP